SVKREQKQEPATSKQTMDSLATALDCQWPLLCVNCDHPQPLMGFRGFVFNQPNKTITTENVLCVPSTYVTQQVQGLSSKLRSGVR
ncbi:hypothetical protein J6590_052632, partial [Homalodisca vitripennis]